MMTAVEEFGNLNEVMDEVADCYKAQFKSMIKTLSALVTLGLIISVGTVVNYLHIAFSLGIFGVTGSNSE